MQTRRVTEVGRQVCATGAHGHQIVRKSALTVIAGLAAVTLSSCSMDWASMAELPSAAAAPAATTPAATTPDAAPDAADADAAAAAVVPSGDLATGSATHVVAAGAAQLAVDYWTADAPASLGSDATTLVQLSAHLEGEGAGAETRVSRFRATAVDPDGAPAVLLDDAGSFAITAPYSYSTAVEVPTRGVGDSTAVNLQWDLLVETAPGSGVWFRQTVVDSLALGLPAATPSSTSTSTPSTTTPGARS